jgi:GTP-binding protein YchF
MALHVGIVGLPNVGKSTLFKALTKKAVDINNYPFCTIEPNVGVVEVPDDRLEALADLSRSEKIVPTIIEFVDIAGLVKGASEGEGLGNKFLANIREVDAIVQVVRVFGNDTITHVHDSVDPARDIEIIETELMLADMVTVEKTLVRLEKLARGNDKDAAIQKDIVIRIKEALDRGELARSVTIDLSIDPVKKIVREMSLLTMKPIMYVYNVSDMDAPLDDALTKRSHVKLDIKIEEELMDMSTDEAAELGMVSHLSDLITEAFVLLGLQTFLTTGEKETRAWTITKGATAPEAGAAIHNDFKDRFIRADVVNWKKLIEAGSWSNARDIGALRTVGKDYIMQDGDVVEFKV